MTETCTNCGYPTDRPSPSCAAFKHPMAKNWLVVARERLEAADPDRNQLMLVTIWQLLVCTEILAELVAMHEKGHLEGSGTRWEATWEQARVKLEGK